MSDAILEMQNYNINGHIHNYAVWTAARAVQRRFQGATTKSISNAINDAGLKAKFLDSDIKWTDDKFEKIHEEVAKKLCSNLNDCKYGRAAKIIAIYIKTSVIIVDKGECDLSKVAHPPIDRKLLLKLKSKKLLFIGQKELPNWTELDEPEYSKIINDIRNILGDFPMWKIEKYWHV